MTSRPDISFDTQGRVTMHLEQNGIAMVLRFSPEIAEEISRKFADMAHTARAVSESIKNQLQAQGIPPLGAPSYSGCSTVEERIEAHAQLKAQAEAERAAEIRTGGGLQGMGGTPVRREEGATEIVRQSGAEFGEQGSR